MNDSYKSSPDSPLVDGGVVQQQRRSDDADALIAQLVEQHHGGVLSSVATSPGSNSKNWVKETIAILQHCQNKLKNSNLLSRNLHGVQMSIPFHLSLSKFPSLVKAIQEINNNTNELCCFKWTTTQKTTDFKLQWGPTSQDNNNNNNNNNNKNRYSSNIRTTYIPPGYEDFEKDYTNNETQQHHAQEDNQYIYLVQITPEDGPTTKDASILLQDIELLSFLNKNDDDNNGSQNAAEKDTNLAAATWFKESLSIRVIPTTRFIDIFHDACSCCDDNVEDDECSYNNLVDAIVEEERCVNFPCRINNGGVIIVIFQNLCYQAEEYVDQSVKHNVFGSNNTTNPHQQQLFGAILAKMNRLDVVAPCFSRSIHQQVVATTTGSDNNMLFSSSLSYCIFVVGQRIPLKLPPSGRNVVVKNNKSKEEEEEMMLATELLKLAVLNSSRFIPQNKRKQWDNLPHALLFIAPYKYLPLGLSDWLTEPGMLRSPFDNSMANCLFYINLPRGIWSKKLNTLFGQDFMSRYYSEMQHVQLQLHNNVRAVKSFNELALPDMGYKSIQRFCEQVDDDSKGCEKESSVDVICSYLNAILSMIDMECVRCMEDMHQHDMYSIRWDYVEIPAPIVPFTNCFMCTKHAAPDSVSTLRLCPYHLSYTRLVESGEQKHVVLGKSIAIQSKEQLEQLPSLLQKMRQCDNLAVKIVVPGLAENWPLVSIGDLVRFRFEEYGHHIEVVGEVADLVIKTETLTVFIPPPGLGNCTELTLYMQAILHTRTHFIDLKRHNRAAVAQRMDNNTHTHIGRFDLRFGFMGGRGFTIARTAIQHGISECHRGSHKIVRRISRIVAPTLGIVREKGETDRPMNRITDWIHPLNSEQKQAVIDIVFDRHSRKVPYIVVGPAGTGKSLLIVEAIIQILLLRPNAKILICAPSDAACDVLACRIHPILSKLSKSVWHSKLRQSSAKHSMLRINWWARKVASLPVELFPFTTADHHGFFSIPSLAQIMAASVVICQCFVAGCICDDHNNWMEKHFTDVFVDEVSQAMEFEVLVPLLKIGIECSIVVAGDPKQLGPTVRSPLAYRLGLGISLQDRLMSLPLYKKSDSFRCMTTLTGNYRSHEALLQVPSELFYGGSLQCLAPVSVTSPFAHWGSLGAASDFPLLVYDVCGVERSKVDTPSFYNIEECNSIVQLVKGLMESEKINSQGGIRTDEIAIITPFRAQVLALRVKLRYAGLGSINVGVVEDFQGQESKVVFISTVLTKVHARWNHMRQLTSGNDGKESEGFMLGFMHDPKRFNVAITRAQALCIIVGNAGFLEGSHSYWTVLIEHVRRNNGLVSKRESSISNLEDSKEEHASNNGIAKLIERVEELKLLGSGFEEDKHNLAFYYDENPPWKVMLS